MNVRREQIHVQHNSIRPELPVSAEEIAALKRGLAIADDERIVLAVGRLSREKAHIDLLRAFMILRDSHPDLKIRLVIVGDGPERANLEAVAASLRVHSADSPDPARCASGGSSGPPAVSAPSKVVQGGPRRLGRAVGTSAEPLRLSLRHLVAAKEWTLRFKIHQKRSDA